MSETYYDAVPPTASVQIKFDGQAQLLDLVDTLRTNGVSHHIELPQLVVCGDQSSGKSSVLEAISRVRFPSRENLCTRFATELILRRAPRRSCDISIRPGPSRSEEEAKLLQGFYAVDNGLENFAEVVAEAESYMGLSEDGHFCEDVLVVEIAGQDLPHLTLVDLPGIIHTENRHQSQADITLVSDLVDRYIRSPRTIILAVLSAKNDVANQIIIQRARMHDPEGIRTLGIITKPDTLRPDSADERAYLSLAKNENIRLGLGWHVLKNRSFDTQHVSSERRDLEETRFFEQGSWTSFDNSKVGIANLRTRLGKILMQQIAQELPSLINEIEASRKECKRILEHLGEPRNNPDEQRYYLTDISQKMHFLVRTAVEGTYNDPFFKIELPDGSNAKNLRAVMEQLKDEFELRMNTEGHVYDIRDSVGQRREEDSREFKRIVVQHMQRYRGCEFPLQVKNSFVGDVFQMQAAPWRPITAEHLSNASNAIQEFLSIVLGYVASGKTYDAIMSKVINRVMNEKESELNAKLEEILRPYNRGNPSVCNMRYIRSLGDIENRHLVARVQKKFAEMELFDEERIATPREIISIFLSSINSVAGAPDNESREETATLVLEHVGAYYNIARDTFIDNVVNLAVENILLDGLENIFCPSKVSRMTTDELHELASESDDVRKDRTNFKSKLAIMDDSLRICKRYLSPRSSSESRGLRTLGTAANNIRVDGRSTHGPPEPRANGKLPVDTLTGPSRTESAPNLLNQTMTPPLTPERMFRNRRRHHSPSSNANVLLRDYVPA